MKCLKNGIVLSRRLINEFLAASTDLVDAMMAFTGFLCRFALKLVPCLLPIVNYFKKSDIVGRSEQITPEC